MNNNSTWHVLTTCAGMTCQLSNNKYGVYTVLCVLIELVINWSYQIPRIIWQTETQLTNEWKVKEM